MRIEPKLRIQLIAGAGLIGAAVIGFRYLGEPVPDQGQAYRQTSGSSWDGTGHAGDSDRVPDGGTDALALEKPVHRTLIECLRLVQAESDESKQQELLDGFARGIPAEDVPDALAFLQDRTASEFTDVLRSGLLRRWAESEPQRAADWIAQSLPAPAQVDAVRDVAVVWAGKDPAAASEWARKLPVDSERRAGLMAIAYEAAGNRPIDAINLALELPADRSRDDLIAHSANQWASADPKSAAEWVSQLEKGILKDRVMSGIATAWGDKDPNAAAEFALEAMRPGKAQDNAVIGIVQRWVQTDPESAAAWACQFPGGEGELRDIALQNIVNIWAERDVERVADWLNNAKLEEGRDSVIGAFARKLTPTFPDLAARWVESIENEVVRAQEAERIAEAWLQADSGAARQWIANAPLSTDAKTRLLEAKGQ